MPTDTTVIEQIIDPVPEDVAEIEALEGNMVHISGAETITGLKTFTQAVTAPEFIGNVRGGISDGILLGNLDLNGFSLTGLGGIGFEELANKGVANGYAPLGPTALVPAEFLGTSGAGLGENFLADDGVFRPISAGAVSFGTQLANLVFAGPGSGAAAAPAFRLMVAADIPTLAQSKITNLESDLASRVPTSRTITEGAGLAGNVYDLSANRTLALGTPSTLNVASANSASGTTHSHAITTSSNPGAAASILASDGAGRLTLSRLTLTDYLLINSLTANIYLKDTSTGFQAATTGIITPQPGNIWRNTSYTSGVSGWNIDDDGNAEFNNGRFRGELASSVFKISELAATAGTLGVFFSASTVDADFTTPASTGVAFAFNAKNSDAGGMLFGVNDKVRFKAWTGAAISDSWATITARVNQTTYTTYTATLENGSTSATFRAGTAAVDYGPSGTGFITLSADGTVGSSPNMTMATHAGSPWTTQTTLLRAGNLNGSYGYATNVYGVGIGQYGAAQSWLTFDTTNGLRIGNNTTTLANWDTSGNILIGQAGAGQGNVYITSGALQMRVGTTVYGQWDTSGNATFGNVAANQANVFWNNANDRLEFRGGANGTVVQSYIDTDGSFVAGGGNIKLNATGLLIAATNASSTDRAVTWQNGGNNIGQIETIISGPSITMTNKAKSASSSSMVINNLQADSDVDSAFVQAIANSSAAALNPGKTYVQIWGGVSQFLGVTIGDTATPTHMLDVYGTGWFQSDLSTDGKIIKSTAIAARVYNNANISIPNATATALTFNSERFDTDAIHDTGSNTGRLTCKTAGTYEIKGSVAFASNTAGFRQVYLRLNGATVIDNCTELPVPGEHSMQISTLYSLAVNDYVEVFVSQNTGAALNVNASNNYSPEFMMKRIA